MYMYDHNVDKIHNTPSSDLLKVFNGMYSNF